MAETEIETEDTSGRDATLTLIERVRERIEARGVEWGGIRWRSDAMGRQSLIETIAGAEAYEAVHGAGSFATSWRGAGGEWRDGTTLDDLRHARLLIAERRKALFEHQRQMVADVMAGESVDIHEGWPE